MDYTDILHTIDEKAQERLVLRFSLNPFSVLLDLFIESFSTPFRLLLRKPRKAFLPTYAKDGEEFYNSLSCFPPRLTDDFFLNFHIETIGNGHLFVQWIKDNKPNDMALDDFYFFIRALTSILNRWIERRNQEEYIIKKLTEAMNVVAFVIIQFFCLSAIWFAVTENVTYTMIVLFMMLFAMFVGALNKSS